MKGSTKATPTAPARRTNLGPQNVGMVVVNAEAPPPKPLSVPNQLQQQADAVMALRQTVDALADRLKPVLSKEPEEGPVGVPACDCAVATQVSSNTASVWSQVRILEQLIGALEV